MQFCNNSLSCFLQNNHIEIYQKNILFSSEILSNKSFCWFLSVMFENQQIENSIFSHHRKKWIRLNAIFLKEWIRQWGHLFDKLNPMKLTFLERRDSVKDAIFWQRGFDKDAIVWKSGFKKKGAVFWMSGFENEAIFSLFDKLNPMKLPSF